MSCLRESGHDCTHIENGSCDCARVTSLNRRELSWRTINTLVKCASVRVRRERRTIYALKGRSCAKCMLRFKYRHMSGANSPLLYIHSTRLPNSYKFDSSQSYICWVNKLSKNYADIFHKRICSLLLVSCIVVLTEGQFNTYSPS